MDTQKRKRFEKLLDEHQKRLYELELRSARLGQSTPPEILIEIEDIRVQIQSIESQLANTTVQDIAYQPAQGQNLPTEALEKTRKVKGNDKTIDAQRTDVRTPPIFMKNWIIVALLIADVGGLSLLLLTRPFTNSNTSRVCVAIKHASSTGNTLANTTLTARILYNGEIKGEITEASTSEEPFCPLVPLPENNVMRVRIQVFDPNIGPPRKFLAVKGTDMGINISVTPDLSRANTCKVAGDVANDGIGMCNEQLESLGTEAEIVYIISVK